MIQCWFDNVNAVSVFLGHHLLIIRRLNISHLKSSHIFFLTGSKVFSSQHSCLSLIRLSLSPHWPGVGHISWLQRSLRQQTFDIFSLCCGKWFPVARSKFGRQLRVSGTISKRNYPRDKFSKAIMHSMSDLEHLLYISQIFRTIILILS